MMFVDKKGWEGIQREDKEEKERKSVLGERRKRKAATPKAQTHKSNNNSFLPFLLFSLTSPFFFSFSIDKNNKALKALKSTQMMEEQDVKASRAKRQRVLVAQGDMDAKRVGNSADGRKWCPAKPPKSRGAS